MTLTLEQLPTGENSIRIRQTFCGAPQLIGLKALIHGQSLASVRSLINQSIQFIRRHSSVTVKSEAVLDNESEAPKMKPAAVSCTPSRTSELNKLTTESGDGVG